jgi:hypothetical protein
MKILITRKRGDGVLPLFRRDGEAERKKVAKTPTRAGTKKKKEKN